MLEVEWWGIIKESRLKLLKEGEGEGKGRNCLKGRGLEGAVTQMVGQGKLGRIGKKVGKRTRLCK